MYISVRSKISNPLEQALDLFDGSKRLYGLTTPRLNSTRLTFLPSLFSSAFRPSKATNL